MEDEPKSADQLVIADSREMAAEYQRSSEGTGNPLWAWECLAYWGSSLYGPASDDQLHAAIWQSADMQSETVVIPRWCADYLFAAAVRVHQLIQGIDITRPTKRPRLPPAPRPPEHPRPEKIDPANKPAWEKYDRAMERHARVREARRARAAISTENPTTRAAELVPRALGFGAKGKNHFTERSSDDAALAEFRRFERLRESRSYEDALHALSPNEDYSTVRKRIKRTSGRHSLEIPRGKSGGET